MAQRSKFESWINSKKASKRYILTVLCPNWHFRWRIVLVGFHLVLVTGEKDCAMFLHGLLIYMFCTPIQSFLWSNSYFRDYNLNWRINLKHLDAFRLSWRNTEYLKKEKEVIVEIYYNFFKCIFNIKILKTLFYALVGSKLEYGLTI